jgi:DNA-binding MarR family transcriptional regulator
MQPNERGLPPLRGFGPGSEPRSPEEAVIGLLMQAGRRLRTRHPLDQIDPSSLPLAKQLLADEALRVSDLAACVELDTSTVSRQIKQLEDKGIVERTPDPDDGRASLVRLTEQGREIVVAGFRRRFERIQAALEPWTDDDRARLQSLLTRLAADLRDAQDLETADLTRASAPTTAPTSAPDEDHQDAQR